jgi:hypothetical protein
MPRSTRDEKIECNCPECDRPFLPFHEEHSGRINTCPGCGWRGYVEKAIDTVTVPVEFPSGLIEQRDDQSWYQRFYPAGLGA